MPTAVESMYSRSVRSRMTAPVISEAARSRLLSSSRTVSPTFTMPATRMTVVPPSSSSSTCIATGVKPAGGSGVSLPHEDPSPRKGLRPGANFPLEFDDRTESRDQTDVDLEALAGLRETLHLKILDAREKPAAADLGI